MAKKRGRLDEFLDHRKKSQEVVLEERTHLSNLLFRIAAGALVTLLLLGLAAPSTTTRLVGMGLLLPALLSLTILSIERTQRGLFARSAVFNQLLCLVIVEVLLYELVVQLEWPIYLTPLVMFAMVASLVFSEGPAVLLSIALAVYMGLISDRATTGGEWNADVPLVLVLTTGAVTAALCVRPVRAQSKPLQVGVYAGLAQAIVMLSWTLLNEPGLELLTLTSPERAVELLIEPAWALAGGVISGAVITCFLPPIERFFGILTARRLLDLSDLSNDLLVVLQERAPGTFQHTMNVALLANAAAESIGADALLIRVGALYHDIGKIYKPEYFVENMGEDRSIHERLRPSMSKMIIISHVKDGMLLAKEAKLPQKIVDMIPMHHGTTLVEFFFHKAKRESGAENDVPGETEYRYPGPRPRFREAGILMLADTLEAMAKAESHPNPSRFRTMVHDVILKRLLDGQLDESDLTLNDLRRVEDSFVRTLVTMYHGRIKYPSDDEASDRAKTDEKGSARPAAAERRGEASASEREPVRAGKGA